jgi:hypothetical protein
VRADDAEPASEPASVASVARAIASETPEVVSYVWMELGVRFS